MAPETPADLVRALEELLDTERDALIGGDLNRLGDLLPGKEALVETIRDFEDATPARLERLQSKLSRNQALLDSAGEGIRAVAGAMADLRRVRQELSTYSAEGERRSFRMRHQSRLEKRA